MLMMLKSMVKLLAKVLVKEVSIMKPLTEMLVKAMSMVPK